MKICCFSDIHGNTEIKLEESDISVCCGDFSCDGSLKNLLNFAKWFGKQKSKLKILVPGNHDIVCSTNPAATNSVLYDNGINILIDKSISYEGYNIYGSPWVPVCGAWAFQLYRGDRMRDKWSKIPDNTDILITHGPPYKILDKNHMGIECGDADLRSRILKLKSLKLHIFGHIHESCGMVDLDGKVFVNCSYPKNNEIRYVDFLPL